MLGLELSKIVGVGGVFGAFHILPSRVFALSFGISLLEAHIAPSPLQTHDLQLVL